MDNYSKVVLIFFVAIVISCFIFSYKLETKSTIQKYNTEIEIGKLLDSSLVSLDKRLAYTTVITEVMFNHPNDTSLIVDVWNVADSLIQIEKDKSKVWEQRLKELNGSIQEVN